MGKAKQVERRYIRHPSRMPIRFDLHGDIDHRDEYLRNVSEGGVCFATEVALDPGQPIRLTIPLLGRSFEIDGTRPRCRRSRTTGRAAGSSDGSADRGRAPPR